MFLTIVTARNYSPIPVWSTAARVMAFAAAQCPTWQVGAVRQVVTLTHFWPTRNKTDGRGAPCSGSVTTRRPEQPGGGLADAPAGSETQKIEVRLLGRETRSAQPTTYEVRVAYTSPPAPPVAPLSYGGADDD